MYTVLKIRIVLLEIGSVVATGIQANFYSDQSCQQRYLVKKGYTGGVMPDVSGAFGAIWVTDWAVPEICPGGWTFYICGDKNCNNKRVAVYGQCIGFNTGVWVQAVCVPISGVSKDIEPACSFDTPCVTFNFDYEGNTWFQRKFVPTCDRANNECQSVGFGITWAQLHPLVETVSCNLWTSTDCSGNYQHIGDGATTLDQHNPKRSFKCYYNC